VSCGYGKNKQMPKNEDIQALKPLYKLEDGWNGYNAIRPPDDVIDLAIDLVSNNKTKLLKIVPDGDGGLELEFSGGLRVIIFKE